MLKSIGVMMSWNAAGTLLSFAAVPLLSRLYAPADFGRLGVVLAVGAALHALLGLRLFDALVRPESPRDARRLFALGLWIAVLGGGALLALTTLLRAGMHDGGRLAEWVEVVQWATPFAMLTAVFELLVAWGARGGRFGAITFPVALKAATVVATQFALWYTPLRPWGLLLGTALGDVAAIATMWATLRPASVAELGPGEVRAALRQWSSFRDFVVYSTPEHLVDTVVQALPVALLTAFFGAAAAGQYALADRMVQAPQRLLANALRKSVYPRFCRLADQPQALLDDYRGLLRTALIAAVPIAMLAWLLAEPAFGLLFDQRWAPAAHYASWLAAWQVIATCVTFNYCYLLAASRQRFLMQYVFAFNGLRALVLVALASWGSAQAFVAGLAIYSIVASLVYFRLVWNSRPRLAAPLGPLQETRT